MSNANDISVIQIALFGDSGSGKTTFLSSYYGNMQRNDFERKKGYRLKAEQSVDASLLTRYYEMEGGSFPLGTESFTEYTFELMITGLSRSGLKINWFDYPGGWWRSEPQDNDEKLVRLSALKKLLTSNVAVFLIDGAKYLSNGDKYLRLQLDIFKNAIKKIKESQAENGTPIDGLLPKKWIIAVSKADLFPEGTTAKALAESMLDGARDQFEGVSNAISAQNSDFGKQFLLLSSVKGSSNSKVADAHQFMGLQLIAPLALMSTLRELKEIADKPNNYGFFENILKNISKAIDWIDSIDDVLPPKYQMVTKILKAIDAKGMVDKKAGDFRQQQEDAVKAGKVLEATAAAMQAELASESATIQFCFIQD